MAYDVTNPTKARFVDYINTRDTAQVGGDLATKGLAFIDQSPTETPLIAAAFSDSGTVGIYEFAPPSAGIAEGTSGTDSITAADTTADGTHLDWDWLL